MWWGWSVRIQNLRWTGHGGNCRTRCASPFFTSTHSFQSHFSIFSQGSFSYFNPLSFSQPSHLPFSSLTSHQYWSSVIGGTIATAVETGKTGPNRRDSRPWARCSTSPRWCTPGDHEELWRQAKGRLAEGRTGGPSGPDPGNWGTGPTPGWGLGWGWGVKGRPRQPRAPHHEACIPYTTNPGADGLPHTNAALTHPLTSCHLQEEERNPNQKHHQDVDDDKTACAGKSRRSS